MRIVGVSVEFISERVSNQHGIDRRSAAFRYLVRFAAHFIHTILILTSLSTVFFKTIQDINAKLFKTERVFF